MRIKMCDYCSSTNIQRMGNRNTGVWLKERVMCKDCGRYTYANIKYLRPPHRKWFRPPVWDKSHRRIINYGPIDVMFTENELKRLETIVDNRGFKRLYEAI